MHISRFHLPQISESVLLGGAALLVGLGTGAGIWLFKALVILFEGLLRQEPGRLVDLLRRSDMMRAYDLALTRRADMRQRARQVRLGTSSSGVQVVELTVQPGASCANQKMSAIPWPRDCIVASLRRGGRGIIPHGNTVIQPGDVLLVVVEPAARSGVENLCLTPKQQAQGYK